MQTSLAWNAVNVAAPTGNNALEAVAVPLNVKRCSAAKANVERNKKTKSNFFKRLLLLHFNYRVNCE